jgi:hypothetical protein
VAECAYDMWHLLAVCPLKKVTAIVAEQESDEYHLGREGNEDSRARLSDGKLRRWREKVSTLVQTQVTDAE